MKKAISGLLLAASLPFLVSAHDVKINEFVTDPKQDHNKSQTLTESDEYVEIWNSSTNQTYNLEGWTLNLRDLDNQGVEKTPESITLENIILGPGEFYAIVNPRGDQTDNGRLELYNGAELVDSVSYGSWPGSTLPDGNSLGLQDESLSRYPDGSTNWAKTYATLGKPNRLNVGLILFIKTTNSAPGSVTIYSTNSVSKQTLLQRSLNLGSVWENVKTNGVGETIEFTDKIEGKGFYRGVEN